MESEKPGVWMKRLVVLGQLGSGVAIGTSFGASVLWLERGDWGRAAIAAAALLIAALCAYRLT